MEALLPIIFTIHLLAFVTMAIKRKKIHFWFFSLGFLLLIVKSTFSLYWPEAELAGQSVSSLARFSSWMVLGTVSIAFVYDKKKLKQ